MSQSIMAVSRHIFVRLLSHSPEELQRLANEDARRVIPALCFTEDDIRQNCVQEEQWDELTDDEQNEAITALLDSDEYLHAGTAANEAIAVAAANYLYESLAEKIGPK